MKKIVFILWLILSSNLCHAEYSLIYSKISLDEATKQILKDSNIRVLSATTEIIDGREVHIIKVLTPDGHIRYHKIDAETGASIS